MSDPRPISRRRFLGQASCAAIGSTALFNTLLNLRMAGTAAGQSIGGGNDYRAWCACSCPAATIPSTCWCRAATRNMPSMRPSGATWPCPRPTCWP
jgi:hypothetical protein